VTHELTAAELAPRAEQRRDTREPDRESNDARRARALIVEHRQCDDQHPQRRGGIPKAGHDRRGVLLAVREQRPRHRVEQHCGNRAVKPDAPIGRQALAAQRHQQEQGGRTERHAAE
jgi:hypothetical protein